MPQEIKTMVYTLAELEALGNEKAIEKAYNWLYEASCNHDWWNFVYYDAKQVGVKIEGFDLDRGRSIDLRLAWDAPSVAVAIKREHGDQTPTHKLACDFLSVDDEYNGVNGKITLGSHDDSELSLDALSDLEEEYEEKVKEFTKALGEEYLSLLRQEYDYLTSKEALRDMAEANDYTFTAEGKRFG
jgi:hypothetical protein